ncbi:hypothetical protein DFH06DRAFT_1480710 [Mycena polygramma]|nr:hypothetical protein DFH06DRAFT_1480710 [Mycena polygramma]
MRVNPVFASLCILPLAYGAVVARNHSEIETFPTQGNTNVPGTLFPAKHPDKDVHDLNNLKANKGATLYYEEPTASESDAGPMSAHVDVTAFKAPAVSVEHSVHIRAVTCDNPAGTHISVAFDNLDAWTTAVDDWSKYTEGFYIIAYVDGCGPGVASGERSFHLVHSFTSDKRTLTITGDMETVKIHDAVHPDEEMSARMFQSTRRATSSARARDMVDDDMNMDDDHEQWLDEINGYRDVSDANWSARGDMLNQQVGKATPFEVDLGTYRELTQNASTLLSESPQSESAVSRRDIRQRISFGFASQKKVPYKDTPWGPSSGYVLFSNTTKSAKKTANDDTETSTSSERTFGLYCIRCHAELKLNFFILVEWSVLRGITRALVNLDGTGEMQIVLGLEANYQFMYDVTKSLPIPKPSPFQVPGVINFGPTFDVDIGASLTVDVQGRVSAGYTYTWDRISANLDLVNRGRSQSSGWTPTQTKHFGAEASIKVTFTPFVEFRLGIQLEVFGALSKKLKIGIYIGDRISLELALALTVTADASGVTIGDADCAGVTFSAKLTGQLFLLATAGKKAKKINLFTHPEVNIANECYELAGVITPRTRALGARQDTGQSPSYLLSSTSGSMGDVVPLLLFGEGIGGSFTLPTGVDPDFRFYSTEAATYYTVQDGGEQTLVIFKDTLRTTGMSRCRMKAQTEIPRYAVYAAFATLIDTASGTAYGMVVSELGVHWPVLCTDDNVLDLYLVNGKQGLGNLMSNDFPETFSTGNITQCAYLNFTAQSTLPLSPSTSATSSLDDSTGGGSDDSTMGGEPDTFASGDSPDTTSGSSGDDASSTDTAGDSDSTE